MNTLLFTLEYPPFKGGIARYNHHVVKDWPAPDKIFVLHNNDGRLLSSIIWPHWLPSIWRLYRVIKQNNIKHVLVSQILPLGTVTYFIAKISKIKYSIFLHGQDLAFAQKTGKKKFLAKLILKKSYSIICNSAYVAKMAKIFLGKAFEEKIKVVNPGITPRAFLDFSRIAELKNKHGLNGKFVLFSLGRLVKRKGFDRLVESMPSILKKIPNCVYVLAGIGPDEKYLKKIAANYPKIKNNIIFLGQVDERDKWVWLHLCDLFAMPARNINGDVEGFGIVYLEANLAGKAVIAGDSGGVKDAVIDYENGLVVDPDSTNEIAGSIIELYQKPLLRQNLSNCGLRRAAKEFQWVRQVDKIFKIVNRES